MHSVLSHLNEAEKNGKTDNEYMSGLTRGYKDNDKLLECIVNTYKAQLTLSLT